MASPSYLGRRGRPKTPADLAEHDCLIYSGSASPDWMVYSGKRAISVRPMGRLRSDSGDVLMQWALAGLGIVNAPSFLIEREIEDNRLEVVLGDYAAPEFGVYVVRPPGAGVPVKVRALIDDLAAYFSRDERLIP